MKMKSFLLHYLAAFLAYFGLSLGVVIAQGIRKTVAFKKQVSLGTPATGAGGQLLRRESAVGSLTKAKYESSEIVSHQQSTGTRHGLQAVSYKLSGLLSPGTYKSFMQSAMRKDYVTGVNTTALTNVTAASTAGQQGTFTRAAGSFITDGFKVGDVIRWVGWTAGGVNNNTKNMVIILLTATVMTVSTLDGSAVVAKASGDSVTGTVTGKKTNVPTTAHTDDLYTVEDFYPDVIQSELWSDLKLNQMVLDIPASGNSKVSFDFIGLKRALNVTQQLTTPSAETTSPILEAVTGFLLVNGTEYEIVTSVSITVDQGATANGPVIGSNFSPDIARGKVKVSGSFSAYFTDTVLMSLYDADSTLNLVVIVCGDTTAAADFVGVTLGRIRLDGDAPDDGEKGIVRQYPFTAELNVNGGTGTSSDQSIMSLQDSLA